MTAPFPPFPARPLPTAPAPAGADQPTGPLPPVPPRLTPPVQPEPRRRRVWHRAVAGIAGLLAVVVVAYGCLSLVDVAARTTTRTSRTVAAAAVIRLDLDGASGVTIIGEERTDIRLDRKLRKGLRDVKVQERRAGDTLVLDSNCPIFLGTLCRVDYDLRVPLGTDVVGSTDGGHIRMTGVGRIDVSSGGGGIDFERTNGPVDIWTGGGSIDGRSVTSSEFKARSGGGSIDVRFVEPPDRVDVATGGGGVNVVVPDDAPPYFVDAKSGGGSTSVEIATDPDAPRSIKAHSGGGSVEVRHPEPGG